MKSFAGITFTGTRKDGASPRATKNSRRRAMGGLQHIPSEIGGAGAQSSD